MPKRKIEEIIGPEAKIKVEHDIRETTKELYELQIEMEYDRAEEKLIFEMAGINLY